MDVLPKSLRIPQWFAQATLSRWGFEAMLSIEEGARRNGWEDDECTPPSCSFVPPDMTAQAGVLADTPPIMPGSPEFQAPAQRQTSGRDDEACMKAPQLPVCCKFLDFQLVGKPDSRDVEWPEHCKEESRFERWSEVPLSSLAGNACALLLIVLLSFIGLLIALKMRD
jgi:hypothetical protein